MRRLPIYFMIDVSESMVGYPISQVQKGMDLILRELRSDPYALETVYISIIAFAGKAKRITPLVELISFYSPQIPIGSGTSLGVGLDFLMKDIDINIKPNTYDEKGDWKPIVFLFTDGNPTDSYQAVFNKWNEKYRKKTNLVAISIGQDVGSSVLNKITENVLQLKDDSEASFRAFFQWVSSSIKVSSVSVSEQNTDEFRLAPYSDDILSKIEIEMNAPEKVDENCAVMVAKCQKTKQTYLIKYQRGGLGIISENFSLAGAYPVDDAYTELSDGTVRRTSISTGQLSGFPSCPCCGNAYGFTTCSCGSIMCAGEDPTGICPWCSQQVQFGFSNESTNVIRTQG